MDSMLKFLKLKGWINQPPLYPNVAPNTPERIDSGEAYHLWDHLTFRYDNIEQTQMFYELAHDGDLKLLIKQGLQDTLKEQIARLEKEVLYFGIPMPKAHAKVRISVENTEILDDDYIYRTMLIGMQGASIMHVQAYKQCVTNDRLRKIFKQLLIEEVNIINKLIKYGKSKSWLNVPPNYKL